MSKIKLLYDMEQLSVDGLKGTGVVRVCDVLLHKLLNSDKIDVYPIVTTKRGNIMEYLKAKNLEQLKDKIIYMPELKATTKNQNWYQRLRTKVFTKLLLLKYQKTLDKFDVYLSVFSPISPVLYHHQRIKTFMFVHDLIPIYYPDGCEPKFVRKFTDWIKRGNPDGWFCVSDYTIKDLLRFRPDVVGQPIHKVYLGAADNFYPVTDTKVLERVKDKYGIKTSEYFLAVSEVTARKNLVHLLKSFVRFLDETQNQDISLVLVGPVRKGYEDVAKQVAGLERYQDKIVQTGFADNEDLAPLYSGASVFIYPSLYEGFGLPILEAMQCGTPVITCNNTSLPEVGGKAVEYISGHSEEETAAALKKIYSSAEIRQQMREAGLQQAQNFSWQKMSSRVEDVLIG